MEIQNGNLQLKLNFLPPVLIAVWPGEDFKSVLSLG